MLLGALPNLTVHRTDCLFFFFFSFLECMTHIHHYLSETVLYLAPKNLADYAWANYPDRGLHTGFAAGVCTYATLLLRSFSRRTGSGPVGWIATQLPLQVDLAYGP